MSDDRTIKDRFSISADELQHRMELQQKYHVEPLQKAVFLLDTALERVLGKLGVMIEAGHIPEQQEALGIIIQEETREEMAGLMGYFIHVRRRGEIIPYAWVGAARVNTQGECFVDIQYFQDNRLEETGGFKIENAGGKLH